MNSLYCHIEPVHEVSRLTRRLIQDANKGLEKYSPELCEEGVNGTYFLKNVMGEKLAVFKPADEEGHSINNPKADASSETDLEGIVTGECFKREWIASVLDEDEDHFYGVPDTTIVKICCRQFTSGSREQLADGSWVYSKIGSFQQYIAHDGSAEDVGVSQFPVKEVHKIGILDLRIFNMDRHDGNILFKRNPNNPKDCTLIPIDHGFSLPKRLERSWFCWMTWPQAKQPFDADTKQHILNIKTEKYVKYLESINMDKDTINNLLKITSLLKEGVKLNQTLYQIAIQIQNEKFENSQPTSK